MTNQQGAPEALNHTKYLTVVYRDIKPGDEARELIIHPKMTAASWDHVMNERDRLAALVEAQQPATHVQQSAEIEHVAGDVSKNGAEVNMMGLIDDYAEARHVGGCNTYNAKTAEARAKVITALRTQQPAPAADAVAGKWPVGWSVSCAGDAWTVVAPDGQRRVWHEKTTSHDDSVFMWAFLEALNGPRLSPTDWAAVSNPAYEELPDSLICAVDQWFADNIKDSDGCATQDVRELAEIFYGVTHEGGRESVDDALAIVKSFGPGIGGINDTYARQVLLAEEVERLRGQATNAKKTGELLMGLAVIREITGTQQKGLEETIEAVRAAVNAQKHPPAPAVPAVNDDLRDTLVAISEAIANQDDRAAQVMLREILKAPQPSPTPQADSQPAPVVDKCTKQQMTTEVLRRMQQQEDGHNKNPFRSLLERLMRNEGGYSTIEIGQLKYTLDGFYGAARAQADSQPAHQWDTGYPPLPRPDLYDSAAGTVGWSESAMQGFVDADRAARAQADSQPAPSTASKAVLAAIRAANMQLVRTGDDGFMLVTYKNAKAQCDGGKCGIGGYCDDCPAPQADSVTAPAGGVSLRDEFEAHWRRKYAPLPMNTRMRDDGRYGDPTIQQEWEAWQAAAPTPPAQAADSVLEDAARLEQIAEAIRDYHYALDTRKHGGVAESAAFNSICLTMGMQWEQGKEADRRTALAANGGKP